MSIDPKFVELTADVVRMIYKINPTINNKSIHLSINRSISQ